jgi:hypothetical protein
MARGVGGSKYDSKRSGHSSFPPLKRTSPSPGVGRSLERGAVVWVRERQALSRSSTHRAVPHAACLRPAPKPRTTTARRQTTRTAPKAGRRPTLRPACTNSMRNSAKTGYCAFCPGRRRFADCGEGRRCQRVEAQTASVLYEAVDQRRAGRRDGGLSWSGSRPGSSRPHTLSSAVVRDRWRGQPKFGAACWRRPTSAEEQLRCCDSAPAATSASNYGAYGRVVRRRMSTCDVSGRLCSVISPHATAGSASERRRRSSRNAWRCAAAATRVRKCAEADSIATY